MRSKLLGEVTIDGVLVMPNIQAAIGTPPKLIALNTAGQQVTINNVGITSPLNGYGQMYSHKGTTDWALLPPLANNYILQYDDTTTTGQKWTLTPSGLTSIGVGNLQLAGNTLSSNSGNIIITPFNNIITSGNLSINNSTNTITTNVTTKDLNIVLDTTGQFNITSGITGAVNIDVETTYGNSLATTQYMRKLFGQGSGTCGYLKYYYDTGTATNQYFEIGEIAGAAKVNMTKGGIITLTGTVRTPSVIAGTMISAGLLGINSSNEIIKTNTLINNYTITNSSTTSQTLLELSQPNILSNNLNTLKISGGIGGSYMTINKVCHTTPSASYTQIIDGSSTLQITNINMSLINSINSSAELFSIESNLTNGLYIDMAFRRQGDILRKGIIRYQYHSVSTVDNYIGIGTNSNIDCFKVSSDGSCSINPSILDCAINLVTTKTLKLVANNDASQTIMSMYNSGLNGTHAAPKILKTMFGVNGTNAGSFGYIHTDNALSRGVYFGHDYYANSRIFYDDNGHLTVSSQDNLVDFGAATTCYALAFTDTSTITMKTNIENIIKNDYEKIYNINPKRYNMKTNLRNKRYGIIAEDLENIGLENVVEYKAYFEGKEVQVTYNENGIKYKYESNKEGPIIKTYNNTEIDQTENTLEWKPIGINYSGLIPLLVNCVKDIKIAKFNFYDDSNPVIRIGADNNNELAISYNKTNQEAIIGITGGTSSMAIQKDEIIINNGLTCIGLSVGSGTQIVIDSNGQLVKSSSSLRYKENISYFDVIGSYYKNLKPCYYNYKNSNIKEVGYIAEDLDKIDELKTFVNYNKENKPESVKYERLIVLAMAKIKELENRIAILESK